MTNKSRPHQSIGLHASLCAAILLAGTADAHAYVDPGTGAMILQIIGAAVAGALFYFRQLRHWIKAVFNRLLGRGAAEDKKP
ncbi:MAG: hypothetical protein K0Q43_5113 [Ramlibacter sp.]|jgi:hypothetical protein|nr:hypothetical protein [Ramlibacter sp.]